MEYLDIVDETGQPTGQTVSRSEAHREGIRHRTAHVWIVRPAPDRTPDGERFEVLLQKRSDEKDSFPGLYDTSSAGHIPAGDEPIVSALRELKEELGVDAVPEDLTFAGTFRVRYEAKFHGQPFRDNEITNVYVFSRPVDAERLVLQESEVSEVRWFGLEQVRDEIRRSRARFCMSSKGLDVLRAYLYGKTPGDLREYYQDVRTEARGGIT